MDHMENMVETGDNEIDGERNFNYDVKKEQCEKNRKLLKRCEFLYF